MITNLKFIQSWKFLQSIHVIYRRNLQSFQSLYQENCSRLSRIYQGGRLCVQWVGLSLLTVISIICQPLKSTLLYPRHLCHGVYSFRLDVRPLVCSFVRVFVRSFLSVTFVEFTSKFLVKVSLSEYISLTAHQKAFIFEPWVPERVSFYTMSFCPRVDAPGWG